METLVLKFSSFATVWSASALPYAPLRFADMLWLWLRRSGNAGVIIIDVFSTRVFWFAAFFTWISSLRGKKIVLVLHGGNLPLRYESNRDALENLLRRATHIVAPSPYLKQFFEDKGFKVELIPNSIDLADYPFQCRSDVRPRFINLRGFGKPYNPLITLKAFKDVAEKFTDAELILIGNSDDYFYRDVVDFIQEHKLESQCIVRPKMARKEWIALSAGYDFMLSTPDTDNTPVSIIEGMALGMCVVSTRVGGIHHIIDHGVDGILVPPADPEALARTIMSLLADQKKVAALSEAARKKAESFAWENVEPLWKRLLLFN